MYTATLHTYTSAYWIDTLVVALNSHLSAITWHTSHLLNGNQTIIDLRHLSLEQTLQEDRTGTREDDTRVVVLILYLLYDGTNSLTLVVVIRGNLLLLGQVQLITLIVHQQHLALPDLVNLTANYSVHLILILLIK